MDTAPDGRAHFKTSPVRHLAAACVALCFAFGIANAAEPLTLPSGGAVSYSASGAMTQFEIRDKQGARKIIRVARDATVAAAAKPSNVKLVGEIAGAAIVLVDTYSSIPGGMSFCRSGEESFLRVLSIAREPAVETYRMKLESCRDSIELASPGVEWVRDSSMLRVHWLSGPTVKQKSEEFTLRIGPD